MDEWVKRKGVDPRLVRWRAAAAAASAAVSLVFSEIFL
jgi:hypothetical protein